MRFRRRHALKHIEITVADGQYFHFLRICHDIHYTKSTVFFLCKILCPVRLSRGIFWGHMDAATSRTIRIGSSTIGLIGLDIALNQAAGNKMPEAEAVDFLFAAVSRDNYIPATAAAEYREALRQAYREHLQPGGTQSGPPVIRIFGTGCVSCNNLQKLVIEVLDAMGIAADIEQIRVDPDEIGRQGIIMTPALMMNGQVKSGGLMPTQAQIEEWLRDLSPA